MNGEHFSGITDYPQLAHGEVDQVNIDELAAFLKDMVGIGVIVPDENLEDYARDAANLPDRTMIDDERMPDETREAQRRKPEQTGSSSVDPNEAGEELEDESEVEEAKKRLGR